MANKSLFGQKANIAKKADTKNLAGGAAYKLEPRAALAQLCITSTLGGTFYSKAETQLETILEIGKQCDFNYLLKLAVYCRQYGLMKDTPALLLALAHNGLTDPNSFAESRRENFKLAWAIVIDNSKMLRNFVQIVRSGVTGRKSFGYFTKKLIQRWLNEKSPEYLIKNSTGNDPSMGDIVAISHPKGVTLEHEAIYAWYLGKVHKEIPKHQILADYDQFCRDLEAGRNPAIPLHVPVDMIKGIPNLGKDQWAQMAMNGNWHFTRMNINSFIRHGVFGDKDGVEIANVIAARLRDPKTLAKVSLFPYQLMTTYQNAQLGGLPQISNSLEEVMEYSVSRAPKISGDLVIAIDNSGSMQSPITGSRPGVPDSKTSCLDVAALYASIAHRQNPGSGVIQFDGSANWIHVGKSEGVLPLAKRLAARRGGSTNISSAIKLMIKDGTKADLLIIVSDNESWADFQVSSGETATQKNWRIFKKDNPKAKLVLIDLTPNIASVVHDDKDILNIGGFSDSVFDIVSLFATNRLSPDYFVGEIEKVDLKKFSGSDTFLAEAQ